MRHSNSNFKENNFEKMLTAISSILKEYLRQSDARLKRTFFGVSTHKELSIEKNKIVEQALISIKKLSKKSNHEDLKKSLIKIGDILLKTKFQSLTFYIQNGERPVSLDQCLDHCLATYLRHAVRVIGAEPIREIFKMLLLFHQAVATKLLYEEYNKKTSAMCEKYNHNQLAFEALTRFFAQLEHCNHAFLQGLKDSGLLFDQPLPLTISHDVYSNMILLLNEQRTKIMELEPSAHDLKIAEVSKMYEWGIKSTSKLGAYIRSLNAQLLETFDQQVEVESKANA